MHKIIGEISCIKYLAVGPASLIHKLLSTLFFCLLYKCALQSCFARSLIHSVVNTCLSAKYKINWRKFVFPLRNISFHPNLAPGHRRECVDLRVMNLAFRNGKNIYAICWNKIVWITRKLTDSIYIMFDNWC